MARKGFSGRGRGNGRKRMYGGSKSYGTRGKRSRTGSARSQTVRLVIQQAPMPSHPLSEFQQQVINPAKPSRSQF